MTGAISLYSRAKDVNSKDTIPLDLFLDKIKDGSWQDYVLPVRIISDKKLRDEAKKKVPAVTISGTFKVREDAGIEKHTGYIGIDIDNCDPEEMKSILCPDRYVSAAFTSISGRGLCLLFKINPEKHREAFQGIQEYLYENYNVVIDPTSINVSRMRFVSYDPHLYINDAASKFAIYPKVKEPKKFEKIIYDASDFGDILKQITQRGLNLTQDSYHVWLRLGFALQSKFGESGREYFHIISAVSPKYNSRLTDKQYDNILKAHRSGVNMATFYYYAKQAGCDIYSERTRKVAAVAAQGKRSGLNAVQVAENLAKFEGITGAEEIIKQVMDDGAEAPDENIVEQFETWLRHNYELKKNVITGRIENHGEPLSDEDVRDIRTEARKMMPKISAQVMDDIIFGKRLVPEYNPLTAYFDSLLAEANELPFPDLASGPHLPIKDVIELLKTHGRHVSSLFSTIDTIDSDWLVYFGTKWLVGIISAAYGEHSPLMLVLCGEKQNTGKTEWFRRLMPPELHKHGRTYPDYYAESKLDEDKDAELLMCRKLIIMDDEMGGKSKKEHKRLKELTSKQTFSVRRPYGRMSEDLNRLAVLCGTTNDPEILNDPTGNRRMIPVEVNAINHAVYNSIDKRELWLEVARIYKAGLRWRLTADDIAYLNKDAIQFTEEAPEADLIFKFFKKGKTLMSATDIKNHIETKTQQRISLKRLGAELRRLGYKKKSVWQDGQPRNLWQVDLEGLESVPGYNPFRDNEQPFKAPEKEADDLPF